VSDFDWLAVVDEIRAAPKGDVTGGTVNGMQLFLPFDDNEEC
jgi:hypothetical protein